MVRLSQPAWRLIVADMLCLGLHPPAAPDLSRLRLDAPIVDPPEQGVVVRRA